MPQAATASIPNRASRSTAHHFLQGLSEIGTIMQSEPTGPVYLLLPRETLTQHWDEDAVQSFPRDRFGPLQASGADPEVVEQLAARLVAAKNPILEAAGCYGERLVDPGDVPAAIARCLGEMRAGRSALLHACVTKL